MSNIQLTSGLEQKKENISLLAKHSGVQASDCYQCGKCTAGCPAAFAMDKTPNQIMRLVQLGLLEEALKSKTIWVCASCSTCSTRCPRNVDIANVMETLRIMAKEKGYITNKNMNIFHDVFLNSVERYGRVHEVGLILGYNLKTMNPLKDAQFGPAMFLKGKISPLPHSINGKNEVKKIFENARKRGGVK
ncbi:heterodisulfide reductase subunit C [Desulfonispora thiosulfatigenes DSM 11270]|uniref:Heterodisulfide reductase subunit C n=1 Tax=Desulfonispora thiosulfatigenes DSM 11270 TaxID=656914 RepID=A0A1W1VSX8_DESTI|nr:4Fe-4S dicluster domain-containing protein [Desulfonispora thiosulfatigenes]SMB96485.1 heterodisulfide reductase subunit C [Desulfonispora thiosulfatigenes DSM 11270]